MMAWQEAGSDGKATQITLLARRRAGFTLKLHEHMHSNTVRTWIEGPYGRPPRIQGYDRVLMICTGVGIVAHIPYIKEFLDCYKRWKVPGRKIFLAWEVHERAQLDWVRDLMDELLKQDQDGYILRIALYLVYSQRKKRKPRGEHDRIWELPGFINTERVVTRQFLQSKDRLLVTGISLYRLGWRRLTGLVSANDRIRDGVRELIKSKMQTDIRMIDLDFQPWEESKLEQSTPLSTAV
ncbi:hypothetical protein D8B26_005374 [Coccidioides posadasii str. Silveira]|uniref:uncharacterized protein n=1 Tax=Coccidioides posadasii (strain RMSCC 757 / Silveira) TaxID=443226 RepID=UPI001BF16984|nr:hypothetical protein D8B26_005374 [Coccidioides posadasii str. Silveira]